MAPGAVGVTNANPAIGEVHSLLSFSSLTLTGLDVGTPFFCLEATFTAAITHSNSTSPLPPSLLRHSLQIYFTTLIKPTGHFRVLYTATSSDPTVSHSFGTYGFFTPLSLCSWQPAVDKT